MFVLPNVRTIKLGHLGAEYWPTTVVLEPIMQRTEYLRRVVTRLDAPDISRHVSSLDLLIDEVKAAFLSRVPY